MSTVRPISDEALRGAWPGEWRTEALVVQVLDLMPGLQVRVDHDTACLACVSGYKGGVQITWITRRVVTHPEDWPKAIAEVRCIARAMLQRAVEIVG